MGGNQSGAKLNVGPNTKLGTFRTEQR
jgi:hypothetical protein